MVHEPLKVFNIFNSGTAGRNVENINHELCKQPLNNTKYRKEDKRPGSERMRVMRDILYALDCEVDEEDGENGDEKEEADVERGTEQGERDTSF